MASSISSMNSKFEALSLGASDEYDWSPLEDWRSCLLLFDAIFVDI